ncbi:hypothetical protein F5884DRAFT_85170 [Xylogone sp. PMI_703]|nr:hypothetical protein F5884DRAFT_85170 [Xylogone sp. PMI_703]
MSKLTPPGSWRLRHYPTQTWDELSTKNNYELPVELEEQLPKLPKTIIAAKDSKALPKGRTIVICLDGTGDKFDNDNSNVVNFVACLKKDDPSQITYYQSGIGTYDGHGLKSGFSAAIDMAVGSGLGIHIKDAYRFLMENYCEGDKICLLGFSRGAYTVRCLAGMLHKVGLLPAHNSAQVSFAYEFYKNDTPDGWKMSEEFKKTFCTNVQVYFVGVWDCVASVGFIPRELPFSKSSTGSIHYFRHAMALDEHRAKFPVLQWQGHNLKQNNKANVIKDPQQNQLNGKADSRPPLQEHKRSSSAASHLKHMEQKNTQRRLEARFEHDEENINNVETDVLEVWFAGCHADVGGGAVSNNERHMLSRIPLRWMIRQCFECNTGILFNTASLAETGLDVHTVWPVYKTPKKPVVGPSPKMVEQYEAGTLPPLRRRSTALKIDSSTGEWLSNELKDSAYSDAFDEEDADISPFDLLPEQVEDHFDAMAPINDQLVVAKGWWILEFWPIKLHIQTKPGVWERITGFNRGRYRPVRQVNPKMHWTVHMRMGEKGYKVQNRVDAHAVWHTAT